MGKANVSGKGLRTRPYADILKHAWRCFQLDRIPLVAAGATFFILLAIFPAFASIVSLYGLFADRADIAREIYRASAFLPRGAVITLNSELQRLIAQPPEKASLTFLLSAFFALWSASGGLRAVIEGLDVAYEVRENRKIVPMLASSLLITTLGIVAAAVSLNIAILLPLVFEAFPYRSVLQQVVTWASWPGAFLLGMLGLSVVYRYGPNRPARWRWFSWGALLACTLWLAGTAIFKLYVQFFGSFDRVYGGLGAAIGFMVWIWLSLVFLLFGAELNCEIERRRK